MRKPPPILPSTRTIRIKRKMSCNRSRKRFLAKSQSWKYRWPRYRRIWRSWGTSATGYGKPHPAQRKAKSRPGSSLSRKSCRIRQTRKKHKEPPRRRRNTDNRIWNFNRHLPFSSRECQVLFLFSRRDRFECIWSCEAVRHNKTGGGALWNPCRSERDGLLPVP